MSPKEPKEKEFAPNRIAAAVARVEDEVRGHTEKYAQAAESRNRMVQAKTLIAALQQVNGIDLKIAGGVPLTIPIIPIDGSQWDGKQYVALDNEAEKSRADAYDSQKDFAAIAAAAVAQIISEYQRQLQDAANEFADLV